MLYGADWGGLLFHTRTNATIGSGLGARGLALIVDDDPPPTITPAAAAVLEGNVGDTTLSLRVDLSAPSGQTVTVRWATIDAAGQPQPGVDDAPGSGTLTFVPGETPLVPGDQPPVANQFPCRPAGTRNVWESASTARRRS